MVALTHYHTRNSSNIHFRTLQHCTNLLLFVAVSACSPYLEGSWWLTMLAKGAWRRRGFHDGLRIELTFLFTPGTMVEEGGGHGVIREESMTLGVFFIIIICISRSKRYMRESGSSNGLEPVLNSHQITPRVVILHCTRHVCSVLYFMF